MWRELIIYCVKNKAYTGCDLPELEMNSEADDHVHKLENKDQTGANESLTAPSHCKDTEANEQDSGAKGDCSADGPDLASADPFNSNRNEPVDLPKRTLSEEPSLTMITKDDQDTKLSETSPAPQKKMSCVKFIAQSSSPLLKKTLECPKNETDSTDRVQWEPNDELEVSGSDLSEKYAQHLEQDQPKPQRQARVRLVSKNRKRRERKTFGLSQDSDTDSDSTCSRNWFPTMEEWLHTDKSVTNAQDKGSWDQSIEPIVMLTNSSTSSEQSEFNPHSRDDSNAKALPWRNVDHMFSTLIKQSEMYREQHSRKDERPREEKEKKKNKPPLEKINSKLETKLSSNESITGDNSDAGNSSFSVVNVQTVSDVTAEQSKTPEEVWIEQNPAGISSAAETCDPVVETSEEDDWAKAGENYRRQCEAVQSAEDQPTELEAKIIRQVEVTIIDEVHFKNVYMN